MFPLENISTFSRPLSKHNAPFKNDMHLQQHMYVAGNILLWEAKHIFLSVLHNVWHVTLHKFLSKDFFKQNKKKKKYWFTLSVSLYLCVCFLFFYYNCLITSISEEKGQGTRNCMFYIIKGEVAFGFIIYQINFVFFSWFGFEGTQRIYLFVWNIFQQIFLFKFVAWQYNFFFLFFWVFWWCCKSNKKKATKLLKK